MNKKTDLLVTMALPYANGDIHLGHLVEAVQTDTFVRFKKLSGVNTKFVCADDTHGTPIQINAEKLGITPEELIGMAWDNHYRDYQNFGIDFDIFYTTNSPENQKRADDIFQHLKDRNLVKEKEIEQYYCKDCKRFLPDRYVKGICPKCDTADQYGDNCESCGTTYEPTDLKEPACAICNATPVLKKSTHFFVELMKEEKFLREYLHSDGVLQEDMKNFVTNWIDEGIHEWCISRDEPYFGFKIPGTEDKYYYVWMDAPIGYISSTDKYCADNNLDVSKIWNSDAEAEVVHFIGKDIVRFHTLFWPVMLNSSNLKLPSSIFVHGFLTVQGEKMSKSRGTFIQAKTFTDKVKHPLATEYIRFYYASKLSDNVSDIDFSIDDFCSKINTTLVNNIGNFNNRTFVFLERFFESTVPDCDWDTEIAKLVEDTAASVKEDMEKVRFRSAIDKIHILGNHANKYYQENKPWELVKTNMEEANKIMCTCVNLARALTVMLKPFIPTIVSKVEKQFSTEFKWEDISFSLKGNKIGKSEKLVSPIEPKDLEVIFEGVANKEEPKKKKSDKPEITYEDFMKADLKVGVVKSAEKVKGSNKLLKIIVDEGEGERQIIGGLGKAYTPEEITGKSVVFVANMKPAKLMGELSEGMILAAVKGKKMTLINPEADMPPGVSVS